MSFTIKEPSPSDQAPEFECIFCNAPALRSSEAAHSATGQTFEVFCKKCGARKTVTTKKSADGSHWELDQG